MVLVEKDAIARRDLAAVPQEVPLIVNKEKDGEVKAMAINFNVLGPPWFYFYFLSSVLAFSV